MRFRWEPGLIGNQRYEGYYVDLLERLSEHAHFEYQLQLAADGKVGQYNREDGWNGMLGELVRGVRYDWRTLCLKMVSGRHDLVTVWCEDVIVWRQWLENTFKDVMVGSCYCSSTLWLGNVMCVNVLE